MPHNAIEYNAKSGYVIAATFAQGLTNYFKRTKLFTVHSHFLYVGRYTGS